MLVPMTAVLVSICIGLLTFIHWKARTDSLPPMAAHPVFIVGMSLLLPATAAFIIGLTRTACRNIRAKHPSIYIDDRQLVAFNPFKQTIRLDEIQDVVLKRRLSVWGWIDEVWLLGRNTHKPLIVLHPIYHSLDASEMVQAMRDLLSPSRFSPWA